MRHTNYLLALLALHCSLVAMDKPDQLPKGIKGIFLKAIVSEYQNPVRISQMSLESDCYGTKLGYKKGRVQSHLALVVAGGGPEFYWNRAIPTDDLNKRDENLRLNKVAEFACLCIEDLRLAGTTFMSTEAFVWLKKEFKQKGYKQIVRLYAGDKQIGKFDGDKDTCTLISLKIANTKYLADAIEVTSETTEIGENAE